MYQFFFKNKNEIETSIKRTTINCELTVLDRCRPVYISKAILNDHKRGYALCNTKALGYKHIFKHNMIDSSASDASSSSCDDLLVDLPPRKKKTRTDVKFATMPCAYKKPKNRLAENRHVNFHIRLVTKDRLPAE